MEKCCSHKSSKPTYRGEKRCVPGENEANLWEIYKAEKKPEKIGSEYTGATIFSNGRAIVCEKDKYITIIDTEGKR